MIKIWNWLVYSSKNAEKYSLTIKGLATFVPSVVAFLALVNINIEANTFLAAIDILAAVVVAFFAMISALYTLTGLIRKLYTTIVGNNAVIIAGRK